VSLSISTLSSYPYPVSLHHEGKGKKKNATGCLLSDSLLASSSRSILPHPSAVLPFLELIKGGGGGEGKEGRLQLVVHCVSRIWTAKQKGRGREGKGKTKGRMGDKTMNKKQTYNRAKKSRSVNKKKNQEKHDKKSTA